MTSLSQKLIIGVLHFLQKRHKAFLIGVLLSIVASIYFISKLEIRSGFEDLLPQNNTAVQIIKKIPEKVGGAKYVKIAITSDDINASKRFAEDYVKALRNYPEIQFIKYKTGNKYFKEHFLQYLDTKDLTDIRDQVNARIDYEKRKSNPFYFSLEDEKPPELDFLNLEKKYKSEDEFKDESYLVTKDQKVLFVLARPKGYASNISYARNLLKEMEAISNKLNPASYHPSLKVHWLGAHYANVVEYDSLVSDVRSTSIAAFVLLFLLYYFYCRRFKVLFYILVGPVVSVVWTAASAYFLIGHINSQTAFLGAILLGLVDMSIHLTSRYYEERHVGQSIFESLRLTLTYTGYAVLVSSITLFVAFLSLVFSDFVGFWQFGLLAAAGVALSVIANCLIIPAMVFWFEKEGQPSTGFNTDNNLFMLYGRLVDKIHPTRSFQRGVLIAFVVIGLVSVVTAPFIKFEYDLRNLRSTAFTNEELTNRLEEITGGGTTPSAIFLTDGLDEVRELHSTLTAMAAKPDSTIREVKSVFSLVPEDLDTKMKLIGEIRQQVDRSEKFLKNMGELSTRMTEFKSYLHQPRVTLEDIPEEFLVEFRDPAGKLGSFVLIYPKGEEAEMKEMTKHAAEVREVKAPSGKTYYSSGESIIFSDMMKLMKVDGRRAIILTFIAILLIILLQTRNFKHTIVILTPLYIGVLMICSMMVLFNIKLNFFNIIIFPMLLGIGIDSYVHIFERFLEFGGRDVHGSMKSTGRGILLTTVTTIVGFWSLLFAQSKALNSVGILAVAGVTTCCLTAFTVLPAMMSLLKFPKAHTEELATIPHVDKVGEAK